jgi:pfkB family carbohydrate kinase
VVIQVGKTMATRFNTKGKFLRSFLAPDSIFIDIMINVGFIAVAGLETTGATGDPEVHQVTVTPVDTVGAGDGFAAGHLAAFLVGDSMQERVDQGAAVGALVTTRRGDLAAMPQREEVDALINSTPTRQVVPATRHG